MEEVTTERGNNRKHCDHHGMEVDGYVLLRLIILLCLIKSPVHSSSIPLHLSTSDCHPSLLVFPWCLVSLVAADTRSTIGMASRKMKNKRKKRSLRYPNLLVHARHSSLPKLSLVLPYSPHGHSLHRKRCDLAVRNPCLRRLRPSGSPLPRRIPSKRSSNTKMRLEITDIMRCLHRYLILHATTIGAPGAMLVTAATIKHMLMLRWPLCSGKTRGKSMRTKSSFRRIQPSSS